MPVTTTEASNMFENDDPFKGVTRPEKKTRKRTTGTDAEIVLPALEVENTPEEEEDGELIDGTEDDIADLERETPAPVASAGGSDDTSPAVAAAVRAVQKAAANKRTKVEPMAETLTKAEMIRNEIAKRTEAGDAKIRPCDIVSALKEKGVTVHAPQVSVALRDFGKSRGKARPAATEKTEKTEKTSRRVLTKVKSSTPTSATTVTPGLFGELVKFGVLVKAHGGVDNMREMLNAYAEITSAAK